MEPRYVPENSCAICRFVENGDKIVIDVVERRIELLVSEEELARRRAAFRYTPAPAGDICPVMPGTSGAPTRAVSWSELPPNGGVCLEGGHF